MNGIYVYLFLSEVRAHLIGRFVNEIRLAGRIIQVVLDDGALYVSLYPDAPAMFTAPAQKKGYAKDAQWSSTLNSCRIIDVTQPHFMPLLHFCMLKSGIDAANEMGLTVMLYREAPNIVLHGRGQHRSLFSKKVDKKPKRSPLDLSEEEIAELAHASDHDRSSYLMKEIEGIDTYLARELTPALLPELRRILAGTRVRPRLVSVVPMRVSLFADDCIEAYPSFNDLYRNSIAQYLHMKQQAEQEAMKRSAIRKIKKRIARLRRRILGKEAIEEYRIAGELILGNIRKIKRGDHRVKLKDPCRGREKEIALDPRKSAQENAQAYFSRYKKSKRGQPQIHRKIEELERDLHDLMRASPDAKVSQQRAGIKKAPSRPFRMYSLASGAVIYVGKNARSNDELTFGFARPHDYFFHVRGYEGSHVILRAQVPRTQRPQKQDLSAAASAAAYFSKAKTQKNVPVSYTQRKYVKKDKKGRPGAAIMMREQVMFVDPELPGKDTKN